MLPPLCLPRGYAVLILVLMCSVKPQTDSSPIAPNARQSPAESDVRTVVEHYFTYCASKDLDGLMSLWSEKSPDYPSFKQNLVRDFTAEDCGPGLPAFSRITVEGEKADLRTTVSRTEPGSMTNEKQEKRIVRNFALVRENGEWKVWRSVPAENDLAEALSEAKTEAERSRLLADEKDLVTPELVHVLYLRGDRLYIQRNYERSLAVSRLAQSIAEQIGDQTGIAHALRCEGDVERDRGDYAQALQDYQRSLATFETLENKVGIALVRNGMGNLQSARGDYAQALENFQWSRAVYEALGDRKEVAATLGNIGLVCQNVGNFSQALENYQRALAISEALGDKRINAGLLNNIGLIHHAQGNYAQALQDYQKGLALNESLGDKLGIAQNLNNIGRVYRAQGNYAQALEYYQKSLGMAEALGNKVGMALVLNNIGSTYRQQGNYAQSLEYLQKSLAMREALGVKAGIASTLKSIGLTRQSQGDIALAIESYQQSLEIREALGDQAGIADTLNSIADAYEKQGRHAQALDFGERAAVLAREISDTETLREARFAAGIAYRALNQTDKARLALEEAIAIGETLRENVAGGKEEQERFFESKVSPYYAMVDLLVGQGEPAQALTFAERAKARVLVDVLQSGRVSVTKALTSGEQDQEQSLHTQLVSLNTQIYRESTRRQPDPVRLDELRGQLSKARLDFEAFQTNLYAAHPELKEERGEAQPLRLEDAAALLPDASSALLEYVVTDDQTYLFAVVKASRTVEPVVRVYKLPIGRDELTTQTENFRQQLATRDLGFRASAHNLYRLLLAPAQSLLRDKSSLVIVPDDKLWELPFQALLTDDGRYLLENSAISYAPSLTVLRQMRTRSRKCKPDATTLLAFGNPAMGDRTIQRATLTLRNERLDPLPEAEDEVRELGRLFGSGHSKVYVGPDASEDRFKTEAGEAGILHFATHGILNDADPMYSHLVLAQGSKNEDGLLEAWELMQLDLNADLAVLSACETARGRYGAGEGVIGLTWALFVAGVPSTVVSQWQVESASTRDLMLSFYRVLKEQPAGRPAQTMAEALRRAALKLMRSSETSHPFYWAGFVLIGAGQ